MLDEAAIRQRARELGVRTDYAEKDYVNSWVLYGIYTTAFGDDLLFKGGTALSKLYFPDTWRFSEGLDFTVDGTFTGTEGGPRHLRFGRAHRPDRGYSLEGQDRLQRVASPRGRGRDSVRPLSASGRGCACAGAARVGTALDPESVFPLPSVLYPISVESPRS